MAAGISIGNVEWPSVDALAASGAPQTGALATDQRYMGGDHMDWGDGGWIVMMGMMAVFWIGLLVVAWYAITTFGRRDRPRGDSALDIARRRYAGGEITAEEFERLKRDLS